jgi:hypothetical protein
MLWVLFQVCPVCRVAIGEALLSSLPVFVPESPPPRGKLKRAPQQRRLSGGWETLTPDIQNKIKAERRQREHFFRRQHAKGGIIDLEKEKSKFKLTFANDQPDSTYQEDSWYSGFDNYSHEFVGNNRKERHPRRHRGRDGQGHKNKSALQNKVVFHKSYIDKEGTDKTFEVNKTMSNNNVSTYCPEDSLVNVLTEDKNKISLNQVSSTSSSNVDTPKEVMNLVEEKTFLASNNEMERKINENGTESTICDNLDSLSLKIKMPVNTQSNLDSSASSRSNLGANEWREGVQNGMKNVHFGRPVRLKGCL